MKETTNIKEDAVNVRCKNALSPMMLPMVSQIHSQKGGAALEYILVTTFAAVVGIAALAYTGNAIKEQLKKLGHHLGVEGEPDIQIPFESFGAP